MSNHSVQMSLNLTPAQGVGIAVLCVLLAVALALSIVAFMRSSARTRPCARGTEVDAGDGAGGAATDALRRMLKSAKLRESVPAESVRDLFEKWATDLKSKFGSRQLGAQASLCSRSNGGVADPSAPAVLKWLLLVPSDSALRDRIAQGSLSTMPLLTLSVGFTDLPQFWLRIDNRAEADFSDIWTRHNGCWSHDKFYQTLSDADAIVLAPVWNGKTGYLSIPDAAAALRASFRTTTPRGGNVAEGGERGKRSVPHWAQFGSWASSGELTWTSTSGVEHSAKVEIWQRADNDKDPSRLVWSRSKPYTLREADGDQGLTAAEYTQLREAAREFMSPVRVALAAHSMGGFISTQMFDLRTGPRPAPEPSATEAVAPCATLLMSTGAAVQSTSTSAAARLSPVNELAYDALALVGVTETTAKELGDVISLYQALTSECNKTSTAYAVNEGAGVACWILNGDTAGNAVLLSRSAPYVYDVAGTADEVIPYSAERANMWWGGQGATGAPSSPGTGVVTGGAIVADAGGATKNVQVTLLLEKAHGDVVDNDETLEILRDNVLACSSRAQRSS